MSTFLEKECLKNNVDFKTVVHWQYLVSQTSETNPPMTKLRVGRQNVFVGDGVTTVTLFDRNGVAFGLLLGIGAAPDGVLLDKYTIEIADLSSSGFWSDFEKWVVSLAGRYTLICDCSQGARTYNDPSGANGCVYNSQRRLVASSPLLCINHRPEALVTRN